MDGGERVATGLEAQGEALQRRLLAGTPQLAQVWFRATVLDRYRADTTYRVIRTDTVGRVRGGQWILDFGIAADGQGEEALLHVSAGEIAGRLPPSEQGHWAAHAVGPPFSANYVLMQLTRGACVDDGDVRAW